MGKYEEALERAKAGKPLCEVFPELKESEDEKIRKELIAYIKGELAPGQELIKQWITYLEKQKELPFVKDVILGYPGIYFYDGEKLHFQGNPAMEEKQKEQKKVDTQDLPHWKRMIGACGSGDDFVKPFLIRYGKGVYAQTNSVGPNDVYIDLAELEKLPMPNDVIEDNLSITQKEQKPNIELIQKSWYLEGYHDGKYNNEPKWLIQTGKGGPMYEENPKYGTQNPAEWSEEDEQYLLVCKNALSKYQRSDKWDANIISMWLENRVKSLRPQPHWKPSEEQMEALSDAYVEASTFKMGDILESLYNDLKKLI